MGTPPLGKRKTSHHGTAVAPVQHVAAALVGVRQRGAPAVGRKGPLEKKEERNTMVV